MGFCYRNGVEFGNSFEYGEWSDWALTMVTVWWGRDGCDNNIVSAEDAKDGNFDHAYGGESERGW